LGWDLSRALGSSSRAYSKPNAQVPSLTAKRERVLKEVALQGYMDGFQDGFRDGYSDGFRDGVKSVSI